jgi:hypothetical protein
MATSALYKSNLTKQLSSYITTTDVPTFDTDAKIDSNTGANSNSSSSSVSVSSLNTTAINTPSTPNIMNTTPATNAKDYNHSHNHNHNHNQRNQNQSVKRKNINYYLQSIHVILNIHGNIIPTQILQHVQTNIERILSIDFPILYQVIHQCSEQNWNISNALLIDDDDDDDSDSDDSDNDNDDASSDDDDDDDESRRKKRMKRIIKKKGNQHVSRLGKEKGILAELEEEVCRRMNGLIQMTIGDNNDDNKAVEGRQRQEDVFDMMAVNNSSDTSHGGKEEGEIFLSMEKLCHNLFNDSDSIGNETIENGTKVTSSMGKKQTDTKSGK